MKYLILGLMVLCSLSCQQKSKEEKEALTVVALVNRIEDMRLVHVSDTWNFEVKGKGETDATVFILTKIEEDNFICENEANEFPKKISYSKSDHGILAVISGGDLEIPFEFGPFNMN